MILGNNYYHEELDAQPIQVLKKNTELSMENVKFESILDFAIEREYEAVEFYTDLSNKTLFAAQKVMLKDLADMEKGHAAALERIRTMGYSQTQQAQKEVEDLHISDYLVDVEIKPNLSYQDIILIAMKREEKARKLYLDLASKVSDGEMNTLFTRLANEEAKHKHQFEVIYDEEVLKEN